MVPSRIRLFAEHTSEVSALHAANRFKSLTSRMLPAGFLNLKLCLPALWSSSHLAASVGVVSVETVRRYLGIRRVLLWKKNGETWR
ncbi:transposase [Saccharopolyspora shandongensis]|uniref:transposase n=1 Tax=Saccharopolyspora shandongensis TaxID=418495 RepID=UPI003402B1EF